MSLVPSKYTQQVIPTPKPYPFCQAQNRVVIECGFYVTPAGDEILIEKIVQSLSYYGRILHREVELWSYDVAGAPPTEYTRETFARSFLPEVNTGRALKLVEREEAVFYPWSQFQPGFANLSSVRKVSGYVIYDTHSERLFLDENGKSLLQARDQDDGDKSGGAELTGAPRLVVDSARTWREAADEAGVIEKTGTPQAAVWVKPFQVTTELVFEELDKFQVYRVIDVRIRPGAPRIEGPEVRRREHFAYVLPVPVGPPEVRAAVAGNAIRVEIEGGGATVNGVRIRPTSYRLMRRVLEGGARGPSPDPFDRYLEDPSATSRRTIVVTTATTDLAGAPASPLPGQTPIDEPGDTDDAEGEGWTVIAEPENARLGIDAEGFAEVLDEDLVNGTTYEYAATAIVIEDESEPSEPARVAYGGGSNATGIRVRVRQGDGGPEADVLAPEDPDFPDYGETVEFDSPIAVCPDTIEDVAEEIGERQFGKSREPRLAVEAAVSVPLITLDRGQFVRLPVVAWRTTGNGLVIDSETEPDPWIVDGFRLRARRTSSGSLEDFGVTTLDLVEP